MNSRYGITPPRFQACSFNHSDPNSPLCSQKLFFSLAPSLLARSGALSRKN